MHVLELRMLIPTKWTKHKYKSTLQTPHPPFGMDKQKKLKNSWFFWEKRGVAGNCLKF